MNMTEIKKVAAELGIKPGKMKKTELVRAIQEAEGNPQCFLTGFAASCGQADCLWRPDCD